MPIWRKQHELARVLVHYLGLIITAVSITSFAGLISQHPVLYSWGGTVGMSIPATFCFFLCGIGFFLVSRGEATHGEER